MTVSELVVSSEPQQLTLLNGYTANIFFDPYYKRWYYDLYRDGNIVYAGIALDPDTFPLKGFTDYSLGIIDQISGKVFYEPYNELGSRLSLLEVAE